MASRVIDRRPGRATGPRGLSVIYEAVRAGNSDEIDLATEQTPKDRAADMIYREIDGKT